MKIGVAGNGMIASTFLNDAKEVPNAEIISLCVRPQSLEKGQALADSFSVPKVEQDYGQFLNDPELDAVYLGISNRVHYEYAKKALEAGKHVICEKPFTVTAAEADELSALARAKHLFLWEAFVIPYAPLWNTVEASIRQLGNIKLVHCNYSQYSSRYKRYLDGVVLPAFDPELCGGALYDLNIYNLHFVVKLFGKPKAARYFANRGWNGIDTSGTAVLEYDGFHAVCSAAKDSSSPCGFTVQGEEGTLCGEGPVSIIKQLTLTKDKKETLLAEGSGIPTLADELREFIRQFETNDYRSCYQMLAHSVETAQTADMLLATF